MPQCVAHECYNESGVTKGVSFHRFPVDDAKRAKWVAALRRNALMLNDKKGKHNKKFMPGLNTRICGDHFTPDSFVEDKKRKCLKRDAVPTIFKFPAHLHKNSKRRKALKDRSLQNISPSASPSQSPALVASPATPSASTANLMTIEHAYSIITSPSKLKRKLDVTFDKLEGLHKKKKNAQKTSWRLNQKIKTLNDVVDRLKDENLVSESCADMLENTFSGVPLQIMKRIVSQGRGMRPTAFHPALTAFALTAILLE